MSFLKVRCPVCKGAKEVAKLGGIVGTCNRCKGVGEVEQTLDNLVKSDAPKLEPVVFEQKDNQAPAPIPFDQSLIEDVKMQVENVKAVSIKDIKLTEIEKKGLDQQRQPRKIYKRKK